MRLIDADNIYSWYMDAFDFDPNEVRFSINDIRDNLDNIPSVPPTHPTPFKALGALDCVSRQDAIDVASRECHELFGISEQLPSAQPEVIRCKDCKWWDKYSDTHGYCLAAKHGYWSKHWDISIRRTYDADWYCADAELRGDEE